MKCRFAIEGKNTVTTPSTMTSKSSAPMTSNNNKSGLSIRFAMSSLARPPFAHQVLLDAHRRQMPHSVGSIVPKSLESCSHYIGVSASGANIRVPQVKLNSSGVMSIVGELEPAGVSQAVGSRWRFDLRLLAQSDHQLVESIGGEWCSSFCHKHVSARRLLFVLRLPSLRRARRPICSAS